MPDYCSVASDKHPSGYLSICLSVYLLLFGIANLRMPLAMIRREDVEMQREKVLRPIPRCYGTPRTGNGEHWPS